MDKNNSKAKPATAEKRAAKAAPAAAKKTTALRKPATASKARALAVTTDDIALRAYFIAEKRRQLGLPGDEHQDWLDAESQLVAESGTRKKTARSSAR